ncbi:MAG: CoA transferase [Actinomycetota bacterium]
MDDNPRGALDGVKVIEFAQNAAVPQCGRLLAGLGADVVKVEPPEGDSMRHLAKLAATEGRGYATINPGKRAMVVDLTADGADTVVDAALRWADVALVGLKQTDLVRFGLDWERVKTVNPRLVHLIFTPFGPDGPSKDEGGYDVLIQGMSGLGFMMNRTSGGVPAPTRPAVIDFSSGMMSAVGVLAGLRHRDATGAGVRVDASLLGTAMSLGTPILASFAKDQERADTIAEDIALLAASGADFDTQRAHYDNEMLAAGGAFQLYFRHYLTSDGLISIAGLSPGLIAKWHAVTGLPPVPSGARGADPEFVEVVQAAEALFASRTTDEWLETLGAVGYPCTRYNTPFQAVEDPQVRANDYTVDLDHPEFGGYTVAGMPIEVSGTRVEIAGRSPMLGEHTSDALAEMGLEQLTIDSLRAAGVFGPAD